MKNILLIILIALYATRINCANVDETTAKAVATVFISSLHNQSNLKSVQDMELSYKATGPTNNNLRSIDSGGSATLFYIYSAPLTNQYVIISGDDRARPILGYSESGVFNPGNVPPNVVSWLDGYKKEILYAIDHNLPAAAEITALWSDVQQSNKTVSTVVVAPLVQTKWNQYPYYNEMCPFSDRLGDQTITGCVATAMAQIMKYWNYPTYGTGTHSYLPSFNPDLGIQSVDFGKSYYNWSAMPNSINSSNPEIARLMYHCGVSIDMEYGTLSQGGSYAYISRSNHPSSLLALRKNFGYKYTCSFLSKSSYPDSTWLKNLKTELNAKRPVLYRGADNESGHVFVCDGYDSNNYFHFNWGWGGSYDGYFALGALNVGFADFTSGQSAIVGIEPLNVNPVVDMYMNTKSENSPSVYLTKGQAFNVKADFRNCGGKSFSGYFTAAVYDANLKYVSVIGNSQTYTLASGASTGKVNFSTTGFAGMTSGIYYVYFYYGTSAGMSLVKTNLDQTGFLNCRLKLMVGETNTLTADNYENNNSETNAYEIAPEFVNGIGYYKITNANIHNTSDIDYFKVKVPAGYRYSVNSFLYDCDTNTDGGVYTLDGQYAYLKEDSTWSVSEDYDISTFNYIPKNGYLYFKVKPIVTGQMGAYALDIYITQEKAIAAAVNEIKNNQTTVYPSVNNGTFTVHLGSDHAGLNEITVCDLAGRTVSKLKVNNESEISKQISLHVHEGIYLVNIWHLDHVSTTKIVVTR